jgi:penicillin-binding protein 2
LKTRLLPFQGWRLTMFQAVMFAVFTLFSLRMYQLQIAENEEWQLLADDNRISEVPIPAPRGVIFDRNNRALAVNVPAYNVEVIPAALPQSQEEEFEIFNRLSALVDVPPTNAAAQASGRNIRSIEDLVDEGERIAPYRPVIIAQDVELRVAMQIMEERITMPGVSVRPIAVREYPTGTLTSQIVGYMGPIPAEEAQQLIEEGYNPAFDRIGYAGVEFFLEGILGGQRGTEIREVDVAGLPIRTLGRVDYVAGQNVRLTIDLELQQAAETALRDEITLVNTRAGRLITQTGVVIAMNPNTGEILAMVSWPSYDNTRFARSIDYEYYLDVFNDPLTPLVNHAISSLYPPGSVWKLISAVGILQENVIDPRTKLLDPGSLVLENKYAPNDPAASQRFVCWKPDGHGEVDMLRGISQSCDVYFYQVGGGNADLSASVLRPGGLGPIDLFRYATAFGIGSELGVELPGEQAGRMPDPDWKRRTYGENWSTGDTYNAAFGQGYLTTTPLQLINSVAAITNNGTLYQPTVVSNFLDPEGNLTQPFEPLVMRTLNLEALGPDDPIVLLQIEDMIMKGPSSLACTCEPDEDNEYYNPLRCDPASYRNQVDVNPDPFISDMREYEVHIPLNYAFNGRICDERRFEPNYQPPFVTNRDLEIVREGMRETVTIGTGQGANLSYVEVAGKTGTAEYCDDIARPLGLCVPGNWPAHAWFSAYAPYQNPEIIVIGFVYNGGEGSAVALPVVVKTMEAYFRLQNNRRDPLQAPSTVLPTATP